MGPLTGHLLIAVVVVVVVAVVVPRAAAAAADGLREMARGGHGESTVGAWDRRRRRWRRRRRRYMYERGMESKAVGCQTGRREAAEQERKGAKRGR